MKRLVYVGRDGDGVRVPGGIHFKHGEAVEVKDDLHAALLKEQPANFTDPDRVEAAVADEAPAPDELVSEKPRRKREVRSDG